MGPAAEPRRARGGGTWGRGRRQDEGKASLRCDHGPGGPKEGADMRSGLARCRFFGCVRTGRRVRP